MNEHIILSIAIPTYNGSKTLGETLESIVHQLEDGVEIIISDNASNDRTQEIVNYYKSKYKSIRYFRNETNLGPDTNFDLAVQRSYGEFVWLFSDDDKIAHGAIKYILEIIEKYSSENLGLIYVNWSIFNHDFSERVQNLALDMNQKDKFFSSADDYLLTIQTRFMLVSCNIVKRSLWCDVDKQPYLGTSWLHFGVILEFLAGYSAYCVAEPFVMYRSVVRWNENGKALEIGYINLPEVIKGFSDKGYKETTINATLKTLGKYLVGAIVTAKRNGLMFNFRLIIKLSKNFGNSITFWLICIPLLVIPNKLLLYFWKFYSAFIKKKLKNNNI